MLSYLTATNIPSTSEHSLSRLVDALDDDSFTQDHTNNDIQLQETEIWELDKELQKDFKVQTPREDESSLECYTIPPHDESFCQELESFELSALDESLEDRNDTNDTQTRPPSHSSVISNLDSSSNTPQKNPTQSGTSIAVPDEDEVLQETRRECDALREMNQRLLQSNQEYKESLDAMEMQVLERIDNVRAEMESLAAASIVNNFISSLWKQDKERARFFDLQQKFEVLQRENETLQSSQAQISAIRESLLEEKELDVLTVKKELLLHKERQLQELRKDWNSQKDDLARNYQQDLRRIQQEFATDKRQHEQEILELQDSISKLKQQLYDAQRKPKMVDFEQQYVMLDDFSLFKRLALLFDWDHSPKDFERETAEDLISRLAQETLNAHQTVTARLTEEIRENNQKISALQKEVQSSQRSILESEKEYLEAMDLIKKTHANEISSLKRFKASMSQDTHFSDLSQAFKRYPHLLEEYKAGIKDKIEKALMECKQTHARQVEAMVSDHRDEIQRITHQFEQERASLEAANAGKLVKLKASSDTTALQKFQEQLNKEKSSLKLIFEKEVYQMKKQLISQKEQLERHHAQELSRLSQANAEQCEAMKEKYIKVLKKMRDDLVNSKKESWQRLDDEWKKRKSAYEKLWIDRVKDIHRHLKSHPTQCQECIDSFSLNFS